MTIQTTILWLILYFGKGFRGSCGHPPAAPGAASSSIPAGILLPPTVSSCVTATARDTEPMHSPLTSCAKWRALGTMIMKKRSMTLKSSLKIWQKFLQAQILEMVPERGIPGHAHSLRTPRWRGLQKCRAALHRSSLQQNSGAILLPNSVQDGSPQCRAAHWRRHHCVTKDTAGLPLQRPLAASIIARRRPEETILQFFKEKLSSTSPQNLVRYTHRSQGSWQRKCLSHSCIWEVVAVWWSSHGQENGKHNPHF